MKMTIKNAVVLIEFDNKEVHQAVIKTETLKTFLEGVAAQEGSLRVIEEPITGLVLEPAGLCNDKIPVENDKRLSKRDTVLTGQQKVGPQLGI